MKRSLLLALPLLCAQLASAQTSIPNTISYQARVADASGLPIGDAAPVNRTVILRVYSSAIGGTALYAEQQIATISKGQFSVLLGTGLQVGSEPRDFNNAFAGNNGTERFLGVTVDDGTPTPDPEISPRQQVVSTAYALRARNADVSSSVVQSAGESTFNITTANGSFMNGSLVMNGNNQIFLGGGSTGANGALLSTPDFTWLYGRGLDDNSRKILMEAKGGTAFTGPISFGNRLGQHINLWGTTFGLGIQDGTLYQRTGDNFAWYRGGSHVSGAGEAGGGGQNLAVLNGGGLAVNTGGLQVNAGGINVNAGNINMNGGGTFNGTLDRGGHGVFAQSFGAGHSYGSQDWTTFARSARNFAWYLGGVWNGSELNPGGGTTLATLDNSGLNLSGARVLNFGYDVAGKEVAAGKIGYGTFSGGASLDIVGAGTAGTNRRVQIFSEGGLNLNGSLSSSGVISANGDLRSNNGWAFANRFAMKNNNGNYRWLIKGEVDFDFEFDGSTRYRIDGNGATFKLSDKALKKDFAPIAQTIPQVMKLKPTAYHFKPEDKDKPLSFGFVAQEVAEIYPNLVTKLDDGHIALNYEGLIPVAVAAIQEQQKQIESRDAEIAELKHELAAAKEANSLQDTRLAAIEKALKLESPAAGQPEKKVARR